MPIQRDDGPLVRYLGPDDVFIARAEGESGEQFTFDRGVAVLVTRALADWAIGMNASRQAAVFEVVEGGED